MLFFCRFSRYIRRLPLHDIGCWSAALKGLSKGALFFYQAIRFVLIVDLWALAGRRREFGVRAGPKKSFGAARSRFLLRMSLLRGILDFRNMVGEEVGIITIGGGGLGYRRLACSIIRVFASAVRR